MRAVRYAMAGVMLVAALPVAAGRRGRSPSGVNRDRSERRPGPFPAGPLATAPEMVHTIAVNYMPKWGFWEFMTALPPVVVVGAGPAGLAAAAALGQAGVDCVVLERGSSVATSWRNRHDDLRLNTIRWLSDLPGLAVPRSAGRWVSRDDYISYLERFAACHRLDVRTGIHVQRLEPAAGGGWVVASSAGRDETSQVVVATGYDRVPWTPDWPGRAGFARPVMHVSGLRRASDLAGLQVLLVGG